MIQDNGCADDRIWTHHAIGKSVTLDFSGTRERPQSSAIDEIEGLTNRNEYVNIHKSRNAKFNKKLCLYYLCLNRQILLLLSTLFYISTNTLFLTQKEKKKYTCLVLDSFSMQF